MQCRRITEILEGKGLEDVFSFEVEVVDEIENDPKTGKFKLVTRSVLQERFLPCISLKVVGREGKQKE